MKLMKRIYNKQITNKTSHVDMISLNRTIPAGHDVIDSVNFQIIYQRLLDYIIIIGVIIGGLLACIVIIIGIFDYRKM